MSAWRIRLAGANDADAIRALNTATFPGLAEAEIVDRLDAAGDTLAALVAEEAGAVAGHVHFFRIAVDGEDVAAGLGPMSVAPERQRQGLGGALIGAGLEEMTRLGRGLVFVLGHRDYYPRFGFSAQDAERFDAPWSGPAFMLLRLSPHAPQSGALTYPPAFGA